jgi:prefoldin subunit 5
MTELTLETLRAELAPMRAQLDGLPLMSRKLTVVQQEVRAIKAAFNDFALTNPTKGEIEALHEDVNRVQAENMELATRLATVERLLEELRQ